jgi:hypothetical protein
MKLNLISGVLAVVVGLPLGWIVTMMATPLLWRLEPVLHMELAGHSGPSDWILFVGWGCAITVLFFLFRRLLARKTGGTDVK